MLVHPITTQTQDGSIASAMAGWLRGVVLLAFVLIAFALLSWPVLAAPAAKPSQFQLANGLRVVVVPDHRVPIVTHMVFYRIGSVDEGPGEEGLAHYLEHMMFKGTPTSPKGSFDRFVMTGGGMHNATTSHDTTVYYQRMPRSALERLMTMEADRMENLSFDESEALSERSVVMEEYRGGANRPGFPLFLAMAGAMYGSHPYALPPIGSEAGIAKFDGAKAMAFYRRHYTPERAVVTIGGDITDVDARVLAERTYARVKPHGLGTPQERPMPELAAIAQRVVIPHPRASSVNISRHYLAEGDAMPLLDTTALSLFTYIVGDGILSRLHNGLVAEGLANAVSGGFQLRRYSGYLAFEAVALPGVAAETIETAFDRVLAEVAASGVTETEFNEMKLRFLATRVYDEDNTTSRSDTIGRLISAGWSLQDATNLRGRIEEVTLEDVNRVGQGLLKHSRSVTGLLVPQPVPAKSAEVAR